MQSPAHSTFVAFEAITAGARVKLRADGLIELADDVDHEIGVALLYCGKSAYVAGDPVGVALRNTPGTRTHLAGDAIALGDTVKRAVDGKVAKVSAGGTDYGTAMEAAAANDPVEVLPL
jgi:hypothetical protein